MTARNSAASKRTWADPEIRARRIEAAKKARAKKSATIKETWRNPEIRARRIKGLKRAARRPGERARKKEQAKKNWTDPETRARIFEGMKRAAAAPGERERKSIAAKNARRDPEKRARWAAATRKALNRPKTRALIGAKSRLTWSDPEGRERFMAGRLKAAAVQLGVLPVDSKIEPMTEEAVRREIKRRRGGKEPTKTETWRLGSSLKKEKPEMTWPEVARMITLEAYCEVGPRKAGERLRVGVANYEASLLRPAKSLAVSSERS
jgi:hypothetical protein